jgi:hypothetical protein
MTKLQIKTYSILLLCVILSELTIFIPLPPGQRWLHFHTTVFMVIFFNLLQTGSAILFAKGFKSFTKEVKQNGLFICISSLLYSIAMIQKLIYDMFGLFSFEWIYYGGNEILSVIASLLIFLFLIKFSQLFRVKSPYVSLVFFVPVGLLILTTFIAVTAIKPSLPTYQEYYLLIMGSLNFILIFYQTITVMALKEQSGPLYKNTFAWLSITFMTLQFAALQNPLLQLGGFYGSYIDENVFYILYLISALFYLKSAYAFHKMVNH